MASIDRGTPWVIAVSDAPKLGTNATTPARLTRQLLPASDGARYRQLTLELLTGGELIAKFHEMGASVEAAWGADDQEVTLTLDASAVAKIAFALLSERLSGCQDGLEQLRLLCENRGIEHTVACWT